MSTLTIKQLPALRDNYIYLITCNATGKTAVIDPGDAKPVQAALCDQTLDMILSTHHHWDHTDGNLALKEQHGCEIIGSGYAPERIPGLDKSVKEGDTLNVGEATADVFFVPGHTRDHIAFYFPESDALFCGDSLFAGGCGRLFEGTPEEMFQSLQKLAALPDTTKVYCGHEYTEANLTFAHHMAPDNSTIKKRFEDVQKTRQKGRPTVPSTLAEEKTSNIFMLAPDAEAFAALRQAKDKF